MSHATDPALRLSPEPDAWRAALARAGGSPDDRRVMGLAPDRPVVMSGHQPVLWHAGILAKLLAIAELGRATGSATAWIIADMDEVDPTTVRVPQGRGQDAAARTVRILQGDPPAPGVPSAALEPRRPAPADPALPGLAQLLGAHADERTLALQVGRAVIDLACERFGLDAPVVITCSQLVATDAWRTLLDAMQRDPAGCVAAFNRAAAAHPEARVRPLVAEGGRLELPLWRVRPNQARLPVFADELVAVPEGELRPRALAMTAILRSALCDLFVHGTGGGLYDRVTEGWLGGWDGAPAWSLAPSAVATADAYADLGLGADDLPDPTRARWLAHHARHDPAIVGDATGARTKADIVALIADVRREGGDPAPAFARLQAFLREHRERHARALGELDARSDRARRLGAVRDLALDRTWPWPVLPSDTLDALHARVRERLGAATIRA